MTGRKTNIMPKHEIAVIQASDGAKVRFLTLKAGKRTHKLTSYGEYVLDKQEPDYDREYQRYQAHLHHHKNIQEAILCIPRHECTIKFLQIPSTQPAQVRQMARFQATKLLPYAEEDLIIDTHILSRNAKGFSNTMIFLAPRQQIEAYVSLVSPTTLPITRVILTPFALTSCYQLCMPQQAKKTTLLVHVQDQAIDISVVGQKNLLFSRSMYPYEVSTEEQDKEKWKESLFDQIHTTIQNYKSTGRHYKLPHIEHYVVAWNNPAVSNLCDYLQSRFTHAWISFDLSPDRISSKEIANIIGQKEEPQPDPLVCSLALSVIGAAATIDQVNLLPPTIALKRQQEKQRSLQIKAALFTMLMLISLALPIWKVYSFRASQLTRLKDTLEVLAPRIKEVQNMEAKLQAIQLHMSHKNTPLDIVNEVYALVPPKTSLSILSYQRRKQLILKGIAPDLMVTNNLRNELEKSSLFKKVSTKFSHTRQIENMELAEFQINAYLEEYQETL